MFKLKKISGCLCIIRSPFLSYNLPSPRKRDPDIKFFLKIELCHGKTSVSDPYKYSFIRIKIQPFSFPRLKFKNIPILITAELLKMVDGANSSSGTVPEFDAKRRQLK